MGVSWDHGDMWIPFGVENFRVLWVDFFMVTVGIYGPTDVQFSFWKSNLQPADFFLAQKSAEFGHDNVAAIA